MPFASPSRRVLSLLPLLATLSGCGILFSTGGGDDAGASGPCTPTTCVAEGKNCGALPDGCGGTLTCGSCPDSQSCGAGGVANVCGVGTCAPASCSDQGFTCGPASDGCAAVLDCGTCSGGRSCGGGGVPHQCGSGCTPTTCAAQGFACGPLSDGCGRTLQCGTCGAGLTCGGGGSPGTCGATCDLGCPANFTCNSSGVCGGGAPSGLVLDVKTFAVSGVVTMNGATPLATSCSYPSHGATVTLHDAAQGYSFSLNATCPSSGAWAFSGVVFPGTYDVTVSGYASVLPGQAMLVQKGLQVRGPVANLAYDVKTYAVSGAVTMNGATPLATSCSYPSHGATVTLKDDAQGYTFSLNATCPTSGPWVFSGPVYPGTYDVTVSGYASVLPGQASQVQSGLVVQAPVSGLAYDVKTYPVSGVVTMNGATPLATSCSYPSHGATVTLHDAAQGYTFSLNATCPSSGQWAFSGPVYPGTYEVTVSGYASVLPGQASAVQSGLSVRGPVSNLVYDVRTYPVSGVVTMNGATPLATSCSYPSHGATVTLHDEAQGYTFSLNATCPTSGQWAFSGPVYPGTYDVTVSGYASVLPGQAYAVQSGLAVRGPVGNLVYDVKTYAVSGAVTMNGATPLATSCSYPSHGATVTLRDAAQGYTFSLNATCPSSGPWVFSGPVYPGTYDVTVAGYASVLPGQAAAVQAALAVQGPVANLAYDVHTVTVSGTVLMNGATPLATSCSYPSHGATVTLKDDAQGYSFSLNATCPTSGAWTFSGPVYPGTYDVAVSGYASVLPGQAQTLFHRVKF